MTLADCTVMVVEDHEFQRQTTLQMLANLGVGALLEAADGDSALALLARRRHRRLRPRHARDGRRGVPAPRRPDAARAPRS